LFKGLLVVRKIISGWVLIVDWIEIDTLRLSRLVVFLIIQVVISNGLGVVIITVGVLM